VRDVGRLREIAAVLAKHGFGHVLERLGLGPGKLAPLGASAKSLPAGDKLSEPPPPPTQSRAVRMRLVLAELGPSFIKLGQIASTRTDLLPPDITAELRKLQDDVPSVPFEQLRGEVERSLGRPLDALFVQFSPEPLAAASIGQVHRARLRAEWDEPELGPDGAPLPQQERDVVVKVQRPGVRAVIERDMELLAMLAQIIERTIEEARTYDPVGLVRQFDKSITAELDFTQEAHNGERFRRDFAGSPLVRFPRSYRAGSTSRVLTLEFLEGYKLRAALAAGFPGPVLARNSVAIIIEMAFVHGFFHADPHPGNIIVMGTPEAPVVGLIDLGMVGRLTREQRDKLVELLMAAGRSDPSGVADALYALGRPTRKVDMAAYRAEAALRAERHLGKPLKELNAGLMLSDLVEGATQFGIEIPPDFLIAGKALITLDGIGKELDPELDVLSVAQPHFVRYMKQRLAPEQLAGELARGALRYAQVARDVPSHLREVLDDLRQGRLEVRTAETRLGPALDRLGRRLLVGLVFLALQGAGGLALLSDVEHKGTLAALAWVASWLVLVGFVALASVTRWWSKEE
jgi:ubiquinone biosynthesis protein